MSQYSNRLQVGILLHRKIDDYIDHHPVVLDLARFLYPELPKVTGIAIDLYFDHLLGIHWDKYCKITLDNFVSSFYQIKEDKTLFKNDHFWDVIKRMETGGWLMHSGSMYGLTKSCEGVSRLISFKNVLSSAPEVFVKNKERIEQTFFDFMEVAIPFFNEYHKQIQLNDSKES